ncbi:LysR family transcriptional regulator [Caballeronia sp. LP003]|uniref:LysR family transcriptional regulator n=1 Tax=Caballeronia sp. LP003 TaxID=3038551 RepID=UPI002862DEA8|nr:LysR family transcriptional regulator [Caballeronia sp. LP003]MDR5785464.1 LysR family transcriptional regulator [Caballeronia sp. LP003]
MKLEDINAFVAVVRYESVTGAAEALLTRQPLISRRVQNLERDLGVELLDRHTKPPRPTPLGRRVYERCEAVLREVASIDDLVRGDSPPGGTLRVGVSEVIAELALLDAMPRQMEETPGLSIQISSGWSTDVIARLKADELDGAIVVLPGSTQFDPGLSATRLGELHMVVVARKGAMPAHTLHLADLGGMGWVLNPEGCGFRDGLFSAFRERGMPLQVNVGAFGAEQKLGLVAHGVGLGFVPDCMLAASAYADDLEAVDLDDFSPRPCIWRVVPAHAERSAAQVERFGDAVVQALEKLAADTAPALPRRPARSSAVRARSGAEPRK